MDAPAPLVHSVRAPAEPVRAPADAGWWARVRDTVAAAGRSIHWYVTTLMGDRAYDTYVAHLRRMHPHQQPMTEREFWRARSDEQDRNPGARCC